MSKAKKTWLPIAIILGLAALILVLALIGSALDKGNEELKEDDPKESEKVVETAKPKKTDKDKKETKKNTGSSNSVAPAKNTTPSTNTVKNTDTDKKTDKDKKDDADKEPKTPFDAFRERSENIREDIRDAAENVGGMISDFNSRFDDGTPGGVFRTPSEFASDVRGYMGNLLDPNRN